MKISGSGLVPSSVPANMLYKKKKKKKKKFIHEKNPNHK